VEQGIDALRHISKHVNTDNRKQNIATEYVTRKENLKKEGRSRIHRTLNGSVFSLSSHRARKGGRGIAHL